MPRTAAPAEVRALQGALLPWVAASLPRALQEARPAGPVGLPVPVPPPARGSRQQAGNPSWVPSSSRRSARQGWLGTALPAAAARAPFRLLRRRGSLRRAAGHSRRPSTSASWLAWAAKRRPPMRAALPVQPLGPRGSAGAVGSCKLRRVAARCRTTRRQRAWIGQTTVFQGGELLLLRRRASRRRRRRPWDGAPPRACTALLGAWPWTLRGATGCCHLRACSFAWTPALPLFCQGSGSRWRRWVRRAPQRRYLHRSAPCRAAGAAGAAALIPRGSTLVGLPRPCAQGDGSPPSRRTSRGTCQCRRPSSASPIGAPGARALRP